MNSSTKFMQYLLFILDYKVLPYFILNLMRIIYINIIVIFIYNNMCKFDFDNLFDLQEK